MVDPLIGATENKATVPGPDNGLAIADTSTAPASSRPTSPRAGSTCSTPKFPQGQEGSLGSSGNEAMPCVVTAFKTQTLKRQTSSGPTTRPTRYRPAGGRAVTWAVSGVVDEFRPNGRMIYRSPPACAINARGAHGD